MEIKNPLNAANRQEDKEILFQLTQYFARTAMKEYQSNKFCLHGYALAIRALWKDQKPNGWGYIAEKINGAESFSLQLFFCEQDDYQHNQSIAYQDFSKIESAIDMFRAQAKMREERQTEKNEA